jgi:hypothetical protein
MKMIPPKAKRGRASNGYCGVCNDPRLREITEALVKGQSRRSVAAAFGYTHTTINVHVAKHMNPSGVITESVLQQIKRVQQRMDHLSVKAERSKGTWPVAVRAAHESHEMLMSVARLNGELRRADQGEQEIVEVTYVDRLPHPDSNVPPPRIERYDLNLPPAGRLIESYTVIDQPPKPDAQD